MEIVSNNYFRDKQVLITGGLGMIGSNLALVLVRLGANVSLLDANIDSYGANMFNISEIQSDVELIQGDIRDLELISNSVQAKDIIYSLAGQPSHNDSLKDPFKDASINYIGHLNIAESIRRHNPQARIIYPGSRLQFGRIMDLPVNETHPQNPLTPYALHKFAAEKMYAYYAEVHDIESICFRVANPYGPRSQMRHSKYTIINWFIRLAMEAQPITIFGDGNQIRDYLYVSDLVNALVIAGATNRVKHTVYNIGSGIGTSFAEMAQAIVRIVGSGSIEFVEWPEEYINVETGDYVSDINKIKTELGWSSLVGLENGIRLTWEYYQKHREHYW